MTIIAIVIFFSELAVYGQQTAPRPEFACDDVGDELESIYDTLSEMMEYLGDLTELQVSVTPKLFLACSCNRPFLLSNKKEKFSILFQILVVFIVAISGTGIAGCLFKCLNKWLFRRFRRGATQILPTHFAEVRVEDLRPGDPTARGIPGPPGMYEEEATGRQYDDTHAMDILNARQR